MKKMLGYEPVPGQNTHEDWIAILNEEDLRRMEAGLPNWIQCGKEVNFEYRITTSETNETRWIRSVGCVEYDAEGEPEIMQGIAIDITEQRTGFLALQEVQKRLELSLRGANLGIWTYNISTDEFWADDRAKEMHGHQPQEVHTFEEA